LLTYIESSNIDISFLIPFATGNFLYIRASDLVLEVKKHESPRANIVNVLAFILGLALMPIIKLALEY